MVDENFRDAGCTFISFLNGFMSKKMYNIKINDVEYDLRLLDGQKL
jgi:hypothetical protein